MITMQESDLDTIKFCVSLINKLKRQEKIDANNKLFNAGLASIRSSLLKMIIQVEFCNDDSNNRQVLESIERKVQLMRQESHRNVQESVAKRFLQLKLKSLILMKTMRQNDYNVSVTQASELAKTISTQKEMSFVLQILFRVSSLHQLEVLDVININISHLDVLEQEIFLYMVALVKLESRADEANDILINQLKNNFKKERIVSQKKAVLAVIGVLLRKQKQLINLSRPQLFQEESSRFLYYQSTRKIIKNKFLFEYKIDLDQSMDQCFKKLNYLDQKAYLLACPLLTFYFQDNQRIVQKLVLTQMHRKIGIAKSVLVQNLNSTNRKSKTKYKYRYAKNPELYAQYIEQTDRNCRKCEVVCARGQLFLKYNFNNLYSADKFVAFNKEILYWGKSKEQIENKSTKVKIKNVVGIVYGKASERLQQSDEEGPCFSFLLKDRTVDLSIPKQQIQTLHRFILGASSIINSYHSQQSNKLKQQVETMSDESNIEENKYKINFHWSKNQRITAGKLLWRDLFSSFKNKTTRFETEVFPRLKYIIYLRSKEPSSHIKMNNSISLSKRTPLYLSKLQVKEESKKKDS